jgi:hypothetical protein
MSYTTESALADIEYLRDCNDVERLKYDYCFHGDLFPGESNRREKNAQLFLPDGVWDLVPGRRAVGPEQLLTQLRSMGAFFATCLHMCAPPRLDISGNRATATFSSIFPCAPLGTAPAEPLWSVGQYKEEYERTTNGWRYRLMSIRTQFSPGFHPPSHSG